jgi:ATP-dependent helicase/nuclease subunit A
MAPPAVSPVLDPDLRQRQASDPAASVWVAASAGSGKTKVLTDRVLRQLLAGTPPARILCLTFTKAAAAEMSIRINRILGLWATIGDAELEDRLARLTGERPSAATARAARRLFARVIDCPGGMKLQTIHAFCQSLLRRFPLEAGLAPHFEVMDEATAAEVLAQARRAVLIAARDAPEAPLGRALARLTTDLHEDGLGALMAEVAGERGRLRRIFDDHGGLDDTVAGVCRTLGVEPGSDEGTVTAAASADRALDGDGLRRACTGRGVGSRPGTGAGHRGLAGLGVRRAGGRFLRLPAPVPDPRGHTAQDPDHQEGRGHRGRGGRGAGPGGRTAGGGDGAAPGRRGRHHHRGVAGLWRGAACGLCPAEGGAGVAGL